MSIFIFLIIFILILFLYFKFFKLVKLSNVFLIDGAVKGGKTLLSVNLAIRQYRKNVFRYYISIPFIKLKGFFNHMKYDLKKPVLYSNIPLRKIRYTFLSLDIIKRKVRIPNKSVVLLDEVSLVADSMLYKDMITNEEIQLFIKLFGHYSHGGYLIMNTQSISDLHFNFKRCISNYYYIHSRIRLPFFTFIKVREMLYSDDNGNVTNVINSDLEESMKRVIVSNKYYKKYDCYCYSSLTDKLPYYYKNEYIKSRYNLKTNDIISFRKFYTLGGKKNEK